MTSKTPWAAIPVIPIHTYTVQDAEGEIIAANLSKDDARVMAAAPDLLRELERMLNAEYPNDESYVDARAALAKARGQ
jgi:hypothetical protein